MPQYLALTYTADVDWFAPEQASELAEYRQFAVDNAEHLRASAVLHPTSRPRSSAWKVPGAETWSPPTGPTPRQRRR